MVGTRSRAIRGKTSDGNLWCSASDRIRVPARPASHVHRRVPDVRRRTRRSASTIGGGYTGHDPSDVPSRIARERVPTIAGGRAARSYCPIVSRVAHSETKPSGRSFFGTLLGQGWAQTLLILAPFATDPDVEFQKMGCTRDTWVVVANGLSNWRVSLSSGKSAD